MDMAASGAMHVGRIVRLAGLADEGGCGAGRHEHRRRPHEGHEGAALAPDEPCAEQCDAGVTRGFDEFREAAHLRGCLVQDRGEEPDETDGHQGLQQCGQSGNAEAAAQGALVGDEIGSQHRFAVAGARGVKHAISESDADEAPKRADVGPGGFHAAGHQPLESGLLGKDPAHEA